MGVRPAPWASGLGRQHHSIFSPGGGRPTPSSPSLGARLWAQNLGSKHHEVELSKLFPKGGGMAVQQWSGGER